MAKRSITIRRVRVVGGSVDGRAFSSALADELRRLASTTQRVGESRSQDRIEIAAPQGTAADAAPVHARAIHDAVMGAGRSKR